MAGSDNFKIDYFLVGVPKSASTWIYQCCLDHPEITVPDEDSLKYFDLKHHKGPQWYRDKFDDLGGGNVIIDPSPTYFRSPASPARIANDFPDAKFILSLRNPVDRAFSQFWHEKKAGNFPFEFQDCLDRFMLFSWFIETGFYADLLDRWFQYFDRDRFEVVLFDDLKADPSKFISDIFQFMGVESSFQPRVLHERINKGGGKASPALKKLDILKKNPTVFSILKRIKSTVMSNRELKKVLEAAASTSDYSDGMAPDVRAELCKIYRVQTERIEVMLDLDLSKWKS